MSFLFSALSIPSAIMLIFLSSLIILFMLAAYAIPLIPGARSFINLPSEPNSFATNSALTDENKPVWGTCPD
jgi:hypothetical protein